MSSRIRDTGGFSLVAIMVGLSLLALSMLFFSKLQSLAFRSQSHQDIREDLVDLRNYVYNSAGCPASTDPPCTVGATMKVPFANPPPTPSPSPGASPSPTPCPDPSVVIDDTSTGCYTQIANSYFLRATCACQGGAATCPPDQKMIKVEYLIGASPTEPFKDPITKRTYDWSDLLPDTPLPCTPP